MIKHLVMSVIKLHWHWLVAIVTIIIFTLAAKALYHMAHTIDLAQMKTLIWTTPPSVLLQGVGVVIAAYLLLSIYDLIAVRYLNAQLPYRKIVNTSLTAFSIGHTLGVSMLSAGAVRFRYYGQEDIDNAQIANIIMMVSLAFGYGTVSVIGISLAINPHMFGHLLDHLLSYWAISAAIPIIFYRLLGIVLITLILASIIFAGRSGRTFSLRQWQLQVPPAPVLIKLILVAIIDIAMVAYLIDVLLPASVSVTY